MLYILHSVNGSDSPSWFSRISAFPVCLGLFSCGFLVGLFGGFLRGEGVVLGFSFLCFGGISACSSFSRFVTEGIFEERSLLEGKRKIFLGVVCACFGFIGKREHQKNLLEMFAISLHPVAMLVFTLGPEDTQTTSGCDLL